VKSLEVRKKLSGRKSQDRKRSSSRREIRRQTKIFMQTNPKDGAK
jgi:hypothetical protein